jgi:hypothetical protein
MPISSKWEARLSQTGATGGRPLSASELHNLQLLERYIPPSVLVNGTPYGIFEVIAALKVSSSLSVQG